MSRFVFIPLWIVFCIVAGGFAGNFLYAGERLTVKVEVANIRSGPGTGYAVLWQVGRYHPLNVIQKKGDWYKLRDFEGDTGWISKGLVGKMATVITGKEKNNIRSGPGTGYGVLFTADKGIPFRVLSRKGKWIHIQHADGDKGWIYGSLVW